MFDVFCSGCTRRQLLSAGRVRSLSNEAGVIRVGYECWCGVAGTLVTGRRAPHPDSTAALPAAS